MTAAGVVRLVPWAGAAAVAATILAGTVLDARGVALGVPTPPFLAPYAPQAHPLAAVATGVLALAVALAPRTLALRPAAFAFVGLVATVVLRVAVNTARHGVDELDRAFDLEDSFEGKNEYLPALTALRYGPRFALDRWAEILPSLPPHPAAHPPGLLLVLDALGTTSARGMAALCILAGALATPLTYATARVVTCDRRARLATLLLVLSPQALLMGATSADAVFLLAGMAAAWPLAVVAVHGARGRGPALAAGAAAAAGGSFLAWSLPAVAAWAAVLAALRGGIGRAAALAVACAAAAAALYAALAAGAGYDVVGALRATEDVYRFSVASVRPYAFWVFGSPAAFLVALGLPTAWLALRALGRGDRTAVAIFAVIGVAAVLGFTKAETERIWLFLAPLACLAAAAALPERRLRPVLALLAAQALAAELLFDTVW